MGRNGKLTFKTNEACNGHDLASSPSLPNITTTIASDRFEYKGVPIMMQFKLSTET